MVMVAAADGGYLAVWLMLLFASAGVFHHAGIKIPFFAFFAHDSGLRPKEAPRNMLIAMGLAAALCIGIGCMPGVLYGLLPFEVDYAPYTSTHVIAQLQLLFFSAMAFTTLMLAGIYPPELKSVNLDVDWTYRRLGKRVLLLCGAGLGRGWERLTHVLLAGLRRVGSRVALIHGPGGHLGEPMPSGRAALWSALLLFAFLVLAFFLSEA
jgi:multicomponent Na+:H+ antiporter subunit D